MKKIILICICLLVVLGAVGWYIISKEKITAVSFRPQERTQGDVAIHVTCSPGDAKCAAEKEKAVANTLTGSSVEFARHQCDSPRGCAIPNSEETNSAITAIRTFEKSPNLALVRMTGITPAGSIYYCTSDNRCWSYNLQQKTVLPYAENKPTAIPSPEKTAPKHSPY